MNYSVIIIDDEQPARDIIRSYLSRHVDFELIAECSNGFEGLKLIHEHKPDLIFLDIQMPKITGFEMLELLDHFPAIIFSTAFDEYAIKAFDMSAVDYLLKPYSQIRFDQAVKRALSKLTEQSIDREQMSKLVETKYLDSEKLNRIVVKTGFKIKVIPIDQIEYFEADDDYVIVYTPEGRFLKQQTMKYLVANLDSKEFIRVHRSFIVSINQIVQIEPYEKDSKVLMLKNGKKIKVSKSGLKSLKEALGL
ncbi:MAG: LytTR family transcriptional regulator DNA-binding domain-containing protein [Bacteroidales bacterium]|nr:LytTR family transcriptional regulator DNA-binding domain-containing protein [Bacteroidales bacterium]